MSGLTKHKATMFKCTQVVTRLRSCRLFFSINLSVAVSIDTPFGLRAPFIFSFDTIYWMSIFPLIPSSCNADDIQPFLKCLQLAKAQNFYQNYISNEKFPRFPEKSSDWSRTYYGYLFLDTLIGLELSMANVFDALIGQELSMTMS